MLSHRSLGIGIKVILLISSAFIVADMANLLLKGTMQTIPPFILPAKAKRQPPPEPLPVVKEEPVADMLDSVPTLKLIGTISGNHPYVVVLDIATNKQEIFRIREDIGGGWILYEIGKNRATIRKGARREVLEVKFIDSEAPGVTPFPKPGPAKTSLRLDSRDVEGALSDLNKVMTQARVIPNVVDGKTTGYVIFNIVPGSIYTKLGLTNNDIIERVNGLEIKSPDAMYQLFQQIRNEKKITLDFNRAGKRESANIEIR